MLCHAGNHRLHLCALLLITSVLHQVAAVQGSMSASWLEAAGSLLVSGLFGRLQLRDLQALKHSSRLLGGLVDAAPEAVLRAAALRDPAVPPHHPVLHCGDVRAYLARQASMDTAFATGAPAGHAALCLCVSPGSRSPGEQR